MNEEQLFVSIEARVAKIERDWKKVPAIIGKNADAAEQRAKRATERMEGHFTSVASKVGGMGKALSVGLLGGLVAGGVGGLAAQVADVANSLAKVGDEAKRAGLSLSDFQELKYVAEQNRLGVDSLVDGIKELNLRADEFIVTGGGSAAEAFSRLGYDATTLALKLSDPSALFTEIIGKLGHLDRAAQIRIADEVFGGTGGEMFVQLIEQGEDALNRTRHGAHELGLIMSDELIAKADELDRKFNTIASSVGSALKGAIVEAATALAQFIEQFNGWLDEPNRLIAGQGQSFFDQLTPDARNQLRLDVQLAGVRPTPDVYGAFPQGADGNFVIEQPIVPLLTAKSSPKRNDGGSRSSAMREEKDAAAALIQELEHELRLIGISEVQKRVEVELRRAGASATDAQRQSIQQLVTDIETQSASMQQLETAMETAQGAAKTFLGGVIGDLRNGVDGATALANAFGRLGDQLLNMALDTLINSLFSNLLAGLGGASFPVLGFSRGGEVHAATGGLIRGPGTPTSDSIPARLSNGEFVVRASETAKHLDLLRAINSGQLQAFSMGGLVGEGISAQSANDNFRSTQRPSAPVVTINAPVTVNASGGNPVQNEELAQKIAQHVEGSMRGVVIDEMMRAMRPGNFGNSRSRSIR